MSIETLIKHINSIVTLTTIEEAILIQSLTTKSFLKGEYVVQQGDVCKYECFVIKGCTKTFIVDTQGVEHIVMFSVENWWTSDIGSFISQSPADFNVQCLENTTLVIISSSEKEMLCNKIPKLERYYRKLVEKALVEAQKRIIRNFSLTAKEEYLLFKQRYPFIEQRIPQYLIASYLGITKEFFSKIKSQVTLNQ